MKEIISCKLLKRFIIYSNVNKIHTIHYENIFKIYLKYFLNISLLHDIFKIFLNFKFFLKYTKSDFLGGFPNLDRVPKGYKRGLPKLIKVPKCLLKGRLSYLCYFGAYLWIAYSNQGVYGLTQRVFKLSK